MWKYWNEWDLPVGFGEGVGFFRVLEWLHIWCLILGLVSRG